MGALAGAVISVDAHRRMSDDGEAPRAEGESGEEQGDERRRGLAAGLLRDLLVAAVVLTLVSVFLVQPFRVEGRSMEPLLVDGERILVDKLSYRFAEPQRFDVVVFRTDGGRTLVKRVIALPGERVEVASGDLLVDGAVLLEARDDARDGPLAAAEAVTLGDEEYWLLGDNRVASIDSRRFGPVPREAIRGRAVFRYWPPAAAGALPDAAPP